MDTVDSAITKSVRRLEVFTGAGRRRTWSDEDKARVVAEIETSGDSVSGVARRHGLSPQQLFGWRRQVREAQAVVSKDDEPRFVPAVVDAAPSDTAGSRQRKTTRRHWDEPLAGTIARNALPRNRFPASSIASAGHFQIPNQRLGNSSRTTKQRSRGTSGTSGNDQRYESAACDVPKLAPRHKRPQRFPRRWGRFLFVVPAVSPWLVFL